MTEKNICNFNISLNEFNTILNKKDEEEKAPLNYLIDNSEYELRVGEKIVDIKLKLDIILLNDDLVDIKLLTAAAIVKLSSVKAPQSPKGEAEKKALPLGGWGARIGFDGQYYSFWGEKAGLYNIELNYTLPIQYISELKNINFNLISDSNIKLFLNLKDEYKLSSRYSVSEKVEKNNKIVEFYAKSGSFKIIWGSLEKNIKKEKKIEVLKPIIHSVMDTSVEITDTAIIYNTKILYKIYQSSINKLDIEVKGSQVITINGENIKNYDVVMLSTAKVADENDNFVVTIYFEREIEGEYSLEIYSEHEFSIDKDKLVIANFSILNAEREEGSIALISKTITDVEIMELDNIRSVDTNELPASLKNLSKTKEAFKFLKTPYFAKLKLIKHKEIPMLVSIVNNAVFTTVVLKKGLVLNSVILEVKNNNKPFLEIKLPTNTISLSSFIKGKPVKPIQGDTGNMMLSLPKFTSSDESFWVEMVFLTTFERMKKKGELKLLLPEIDITISHLYWKLFLPDRFKYKKFKGNIEKLKYFKTEPPISPYSSNYGDYIDNDYEELYDEPCAEALDEIVEIPMQVQSLSRNISASAPAAPRMAMKSKKRSKVEVQKSMLSKSSSKGQSFGSRANSNVKLFSKKQFGKIPIKIDIPIVGEANYFEKLFLENKSIELNFSYKKTKKDQVEGI